MSDRTKALELANLLTYSAEADAWPMIVGYDDGKIMACALIESESDLSYYKEESQMGDDVATELRERIASLEAQNEGHKQQIQNLTETLGETVAQAMEIQDGLRAQNEKYRSVLEFYAAEDPERCTMVIGPQFTGYSDVFAQFEPAVIDRGEKARAALAEPDMEGTL